MDNGHVKPQGGPPSPGFGKTEDYPPQATYQPTLGLRRVMKKTPALEVLFGFVILTSVEVNVLELLVFVLCSLFILFCLLKMNAVVRKCCRHVSLNG